MPTAAFLLLVTLTLAQSWADAARLDGFLQGLLKPASLYKAARQSDNRR
ncbi:MAG: hypothetical protein OXC54_12310 [Rhodospirillaceae bacterium]|nr:hypothetical protein [Rhodospirillaceae bacterium]